LCQTSLQQGIYDKQQDISDKQQDIYDKQQDIDDKSRLIMVNTAPSHFILSD
jgi:cell division protein FtsL